MIIVTGGGAQYPFKRIEIIKNVPVFSQTYLFHDYLDVAQITVIYFSVHHIDFLRSENGVYSFLF